MERMDLLPAYNVSISGLLLVHSQHTYISLKGTRGEHVKQTINKPRFPRQPGVIYYVLGAMHLAEVKQCYDVTMSP